VIASTWLWVALGVVLFPLVGLLLLLLLGVFGAPADAVRRLWQTVTLRKAVHRGVELPDEVPEEPTQG
jgi:hypothetical protein